MIYVIGFFIGLIVFIGGYKTCQYFRDNDDKRFKR